MATLTGSVYAKTLNKDTELTVILPQDCALREADGPCPPPDMTLILLHGLTDNVSAWLLKTSLVRYAEEHNVAVLLPDGGKSFYTDMRYGGAYFSYVAEELPVLASELFQIPVMEENLAIGGASMGGYGALRAALIYPGRFASCGAFSPVTDIRAFASGDVMKNFVTRDLHSFTPAIWEDPWQLPEEADLYALLAQSAGHTWPDFFLACGRQDLLYSSYKDFVCALRERKGLFLAERTEDGDHGWDLWDRMLPAFLAFVKETGNR